MHSVPNRIQTCLHQFTTTKIILKSMESGIRGDDYAHNNYKRSLVVTNTGNAIRGTALGSSMNRQFTTAELLTNAKSVSAEQTIRASPVMCTGKRVERQSRLSTYLEYHQDSPILPQSNSTCREVQLTGDQ